MYKGMEGELEKKRFPTVGGNESRGGILKCALLLLVSHNIT